MPFDEIDTEWILFLDDDIVIPVDGVARLFKAADDMSADCISADHEFVGGVVNNLKRCIVMGWWPHSDDATAFKVGKNGEYTYLRHPGRKVMASECVFGGCFLVRKCAHLATRLDEERWLDRFGYTIHDELVYAKKLLGNGYQIACCFVEDLQHLDGKSGHLKPSARTESKKLACRFATWHRNVFNTKIGGVWPVIAFASLMARQYLLRGMRCLIGGQPSFFWLAFAELWNAWLFVHSEPYRSLRPVDERLK